MNGRSDVMREVSRFAARRCAGAALLLILAATAFNSANAAEPYVEVGHSVRPRAESDQVDEVEHFPRFRAFNAIDAIPWP